jgi:hypothetical protein
LSASIPSAKTPLQRDCAELFGNPTSAGFAVRNIMRIPPPFPMFMGEIPIKSISLNKVCADSFDRVLKSIWKACDQDLGKLRATHADLFSGSWVVRSMRGMKTVSMHAYGLAVDFDAPENPLGAAPGGHEHSFTEDSIVVKTFEAEGWTWGGRWHGRPDGMHFQYARVS